MSTPGIIIVDHGSRRIQSNSLLEEVAKRFGERFSGQFSIVEPAHMELAEPTIAQAYCKCVERGANFIHVVPYFLGPGKHWIKDIPQLTREAATTYPDTQYHVAPPLGLDDLILDLLHKRLTGCIKGNYHCDMCTPNEA